MQYFIAFLEGIITFISPCLLPMLPIYISYFAGGRERKLSKTLKCAFGFVLGFTALFVIMGGLAGTIGSFLKQYQRVVNIITGLIVVFFGLNFIGVLGFNLFKGSKRNIDTDNMGFFSSFVFGMIFSIGWTPCVGAFLGSALMMASRQGTMGEGILMLVIYSAGLGIPFLISAMLIDRLKATFQVIKSHYRVINLVSGIFLIVLGVLMMTGTFGYFLRMLRG